MATKTFCDRCRAEIIPETFVTYANVRSVKYGNGDDYELCKSCANELKQWLNKKKGESNYG